MPVKRLSAVVLGAVALSCLPRCGGTSTSSVGSTDPSAGASTGYGGTSGQTGLGGSHDVGSGGVGVGGQLALGSGGRVLLGSGGSVLLGAGGDVSIGAGGDIGQLGAGGSLDRDAGIQAILGVTGPGGPCAFTSMTCTDPGTVCTCAAGTPERTWSCGTAPSSLRLPSQLPQDGSHCATEAQVCTGFTICSPVCTCKGGSWVCVPPKDCVVPDCTGLARGSGLSCTYLGLTCGGGCSSCTCEPTADGSLQWSCVYLPC